MRKVNNKKVLRRLARAQIRSEGGKNAITIFAIMLTALMLSAIFTLLSGANQAMEMDQFRQVGSIAHGELKNLSDSELEHIRKSATFKKTGLRVIAGLATNPALQKMQVEVSYMDKTAADWSFTAPDQGQLPREQTNEAVIDEDVLKALGIKPVIGSQIPLELQIGETVISQTVTLSGTYAHEPGVFARQVLISHDLVNRLVQQGKLPPDDFTSTGKNQLSVQFSSSRQIEKQLQDAIHNAGYQYKSPDKAHYIDYGVNWGYTQSRLSRFKDPLVGGSLLFIFTVILLCSGLVIYHIFRFSVSDDIHFYGLLKIIGTTPRQLRHVVHLKAVFLSLAGIPPGLALGWALGTILLPKILTLINLKNSIILTANPIIFIASALFTLGTVYMASMGPARLAAKAAPIEAVKFADFQLSTRRRNRHRPLSPIRLGLAHLHSNRKRLVLTAISLALTLWLFANAVNLSNSFSEEKYLAKIPADFIVANGDVFVPAHSISAASLDPEDIKRLQPLLPQGTWGAVYRPSHYAAEMIPEPDLRRLYKSNFGYSDEDLAAYLKGQRPNADGMIANEVQLYGATNFILQKVRLLDGNLSSLNNPSQPSVAAIIRTDDYGQPIGKSHRLRVGDQVQLKIGADKTAEPQTYTVCATLTLPYALTARYQFSEAYLLGAETLLDKDPAAQVHLLAYDCPKKDQPLMEENLKRLTSASSLGYESKAGARADFQRLQRTLTLFAGLVVTVIATIAVANFINTILTGLLVRRREFALLRAVGMSQRQLYRMLFAENILTIILAAILALSAFALTNPLITKGINETIWFADWQTSFMPFLFVLPIFLLIAIALPLIGLNRHQGSLTDELKKF